MLVKELYQKRKQMKATFLDIFFLSKMNVKCNESVNFKDFVQRAATATMSLTEFYLATSYKVYSVSYGNFS